MIWVQLLMLLILIGQVVNTVMTETQNILYNQLVILLKLLKVVQVVEPYGTT